MFAFLHFSTLSNIQTHTHTLIDALATGPGYLEVTELTMNSSVSHHFLESNVSPWWKQVMQQDNNAKTQAKTFSPDLKVTEMV